MGRKRAVEPLLGMPRKRARDGRIEVDGMVSGGVVARFTVLGTWHEMQLCSDRYHGEPCETLDDLERLVLEDLEDTEGVWAQSLTLHPLTDVAAPRAAASPLPAMAPDPVAKLRDDVKRETNVDVDVVDMLQRIVRNLGSVGHGPRWSLFHQLSGHGSGVSAAVVRALGLDPDEVVGACDGCDGTGVIDCCHCDGDGDYGDDGSCVECDGRGESECETCRGTGSQVVARALSC